MAISLVAPDAAGPLGNLFHKAVIAAVPSVHDCAQPAACQTRADRSQN